MLGARRRDQTDPARTATCPRASCTQTPHLACFPIKAPACNTLVFFGSGWFWVTATVIKAIAAKVERNPRMSRIFLVQDIFGLVSVTRAGKTR